MIAVTYTSSQNSIPAYEQQCVFNSAEGLNNHSIWGIITYPNSEIVASHPIAQEMLIRNFNDLTEKWKQETVLESSMTKIAMNNSYQRIIGMGKQILPLILEDLYYNSNNWFWALKSITGEDPTDPDMQGNLFQQRLAWLKWGDENGYYKPPARA